MKTKQKNLWIVILSVFFAISLLFGIGVKKAFAASDSVLDSVSFTMQNGASVRKEEPTGLRFRSLLSKEDYNKLTENVGEGKDDTSLTFGMLIAPQDYAEKKELNEANVFGKNAVYTFDENDTDSEKLKILNLYDNEMHETADGVMSFTGILTNVKSVNYNRRFVGVGYIKAVDKNGKAAYKFASANDNARSVIEVAQVAIEKGETDTDGVLADFTKYASLGGIVSSVGNGDKTPQNAVDYKTGEISITATKTDFNIFLNREVITKNGNGSDYLRLYLKSTNAAEFWLLPRAKGADDVTWSYMPGELGPEGFKVGGKTLKYVDIPLNDTSVHDFSQYDLRLRAANAGQNITIEKIEYVSLAQDLLKADNWYSDRSLDDGGRVEANDSISVRGWQFGISAEYIQKAIEAGYTHLRFDYTLQNMSDAATPGIYMEGQGTSYCKYYSNQNTARFDLTALKKDGAYAKIWMQGRNAEDWDAAKDMSLTVTNPALFKSTETASWDKGGRNSIYCAEEENGFIVLDTVSAGNEAHVLSSTEWWAKYANNQETYNPSDNQRTVILSGKYLYAGGNTRSALVGGNGTTGYSNFSESITSGIVTEYMNNVSYTAGNQFYYGLDKEGVYALKVNEFVSNRNSWGGFSFTYIDNNTVIVNLPKEGKIVNVNTQDYIEKGYTKCVITAGEYTGGQIWIGNDNWSGGMFGLNSGESKELDLAMFTDNNPYLQVYCSGNATTVTLTYRFF